MERYTLEQRIEIIKIHYKNGENLEVTVHKSKAFFGCHEAPCRTAIQKLVEQFELLGTTENIAAVAQSVEEKPVISFEPKSTRKMTTERPKRPLSTYMLWLNENREQLKKENPGSKVTDIAKRGGELWRAMKDKTEWEAKAIAMKEKYTKELKEYEANGGTDTGAKKRKTKAAKPAKKIKKKETSEEESGEDESD